MISTSAKVSLDGVNANVDDTFFKKQKKFTKNELKNASEAKSKKVEESKNAEKSWRN